MTKKIVSDLPKTAITATGESPDHRFKNWARWVDSVDESKANGYAFAGEFIREGTIEIDISDKPRAILVAVTNGSMKYHNTYYRIIVMRPDGSLEKTEIATNDKSQGWALRIRQQVVDLLKELKN